MKEVDLLRLKEQIDEASKEAAELNGELTARMKQLKQDWKCNNLKEAKKHLISLDKQIESLDKQIEEGLNELEEQYGT